MPQINRDYKLLSYPLFLKSILISYMSVFNISQTLRKANLKFKDMSII